MTRLAILLTATLALAGCIVAPGPGWHPHPHGWGPPGPHGWR